jgi:hypothetical protein
MSDMQKFEFPSRRGFERPRTCDATFWGHQAIMSQEILDVDDRMRARGCVDEECAACCRRGAVDEWSRAVRAGFVCC